MLKTDLPRIGKMLGNKQAEESIVSSTFNETESNEKGGEELGDNTSHSLKDMLWHGGSAWDAWFSCASNQVCTFSLFLCIHKNQDCTFFLILYIHKNYSTNLMDCLDFFRLHKCC